MDLAVVEAVADLWIGRIARGVEGAAALVIALAALQALGAVLWTVWREGPAAVPRARIRIRLGLWLSLALELTIAADILQTAVAPTWDAIGRLGAVVAIRTVINYFLQRDIDVVRGREAGASEE